MALETQDDYQDKIDDLMKEVEKLYDEGTDKGFKLKREEDMDQEERALETERDYQKLIDKMQQNINKSSKEVEKLDNQKKQLQSKIKDIEKDGGDTSKLEKQLKEIIQDANREAQYCGQMATEINKMYKEGTAKGFKLKKRGEDMDFEARKNSIIADLTDLESRKNEVLAGLEQRALETQEDYQKAYDKLDAKMKKENEEWSKKSLEILDKVEKLESELSKWNNELKKIEKQSDAVYDKDWHGLKDIWDEAKKKGFKLKGSFRSEVTDFETRALETEKDYQNEYDDDKKKFVEAKKKKNEAIRKLNTAKEDVKKWDKEFNFWAEQEAMFAGFMEKTVGKAKSKGFKIKRSEETDFEVRALETQEDYQKAYNKVKDLWFDAKKAKTITEEALIKKTKPLEDKIEELEEDYKKDINKIDALIKKYGNEMSDIYQEAKKKGFGIKRF